MLCAKWYYLYNLKNVKNIHVGALLLVKLQVKQVTVIVSDVFRGYKKERWSDIGSCCMMMVV